MQLPEAPLLRVFVLGSVTLEGAGQFATADAVRFTATGGTRSGPDTCTGPRSEPPLSARGLHHTALISSDAERPVPFYQEVLGFR